MQLLTEIWGLAKKRYNLTVVTPSLIKVSTNEFTARTLHKGQSDYYIILVSKKTSITTDILVHEIAHIVAFERPDLGAVGHNTEYMDILYTLEADVREETDGSK